VPEPPTEQRRWPELTPAGPEPQRDPEQQWRPDDA